MSKYKYGDTIYDTFYALQRALPNISFHETPTPEHLAIMGIELIIPIAPTLDELKERKKNEIAAARYRDATGYLKIGENTYNIDKESQTAFLGTMAAFQSGVLKTTNWKTAEGFVVLTAAEFMTVAAEVLTYIDKCFAREKELLAGIDACETEEALSGIVW